MERAMSGLILISIVSSLLPAFGLDSVSATTCIAGSHDCRLDLADRSNLLQIQNQLGVTEDGIEAISLQQSSDKTYRRLAAVIASKHVGNATAELIHSFRPCATCSEHRRYGEPHDGGYVMCEDDLKTGALVGAYSYGINGFDGWGNDVSERLHIPVYQYDCTNPNVPQACDSCEMHFHNECIQDSSAAPKATFKNLQEHLAANQHNSLPESQLLMKIDIEGNEWPIFAAEPSANLRKFRALVVEFHGLTNTMQHPMYLQAVRKILDSGFTVEHIHGNNNGGLAHFETLQVPDVLEVSYVRRAPGAMTRCSNEMVHLPEDAVNNEGGPEMLASNLGPA